MMLCLPYWRPIFAGDGHPKTVVISYGRIFRKMPEQFRFRNQNGIIIIWLDSWDTPFWIHWIIVFGPIEYKKWPLPIDLFCKVTKLHGHTSITPIFCRQEDLAKVREDTWGKVNTVVGVVILEGENRICMAIVCFPLRKESWLKTWFSFCKQKRVTAPWEWFIVVCHNLVKVVPTWRTRWLMLAWWNQHNVLVGKQLFCLHLSCMS